MRSGMEVSNQMAQMAALTGMSWWPSGPPRMKWSPVAGWLSQSSKSLFIWVLFLGEEVVAGEEGFPEGVVEVLPHLFGGARQGEGESLDGAGGEFHAVHDLAVGEGAHVGEEVVLGEVAGQQFFEHVGAHGEYPGGFKGGRWHGVPPGLGPSPVRPGPRAG